MKKIFLTIALGIASLAFSQYYPNQNNSNGGYYENNNDGWYDDYSNQFPDDYYYDYPDDYYPDNYYTNYYNDYRDSVFGINWDNFFMEFNLSPYQIRQIVLLNRRFPSFSAWNYYYRHNPDRWYYDRFCALENILGPRIFVVFQDRYYHGYSPIVYFQNYRRDYYVPRFRVLPKYRNIDIRRYRIDRDDFWRTHNQYGGNQPRNIHNLGGFRENGIRNDMPSNPRNGGFKNPRGNMDDNPRNGGGFQNPRGGNDNPRNGGFQNPRSESPRSGGFRGGDNGGFRGGNSGGNRGGGFRGNQDSGRGNSENNGGGFRQRFTQG